MNAALILILFLTGQTPNEGLPRDLAFVARLLEEKETQSAVKEIDRLKESLAGSPVEDYGLFLQGEAYRLSEREKEADEVFDSLMTKFPNSQWAESAGYRRTVYLVSRGDIKSASRVVDRLKASGGKNEKQARLVLAEAYRRALQPEKAVILLSTSVDRSPGPEVLLSLAGAYTESGKPEKSIPLLSNLIAAGTPEKVARQAVWVYVNALERAGEYAQIVSKYPTYTGLIVEEDPRQDLDLILGRALLELGERSKAVTVLTTLTTDLRAKAPANWRTCVDAYLVLSRAEKADSSPEALAKSAEALESCLGYLDSLGRLLPVESAGQVADSKAEILDAFGRLAYESGDYETAARRFEELSSVGSEPWEFTGNFNQACSLREAGQIDAATLEFENLCGKEKHAPGWEIAALAVAKIYEQKSDWKNVLRVLSDFPKDATDVSPLPKRILETSEPGNILMQASWLRGKALAYTGDSEGARREYLYILDGKIGDVLFEASVLTTLAELDLARQAPGDAAARFEEVFSKLGLLIPPEKIPVGLENGKATIERALFGLARSLREIGRYDRSAGLFDAAARLFPSRSGESRYEKGRSLEAAGNLISAATAYGRAIADATPGEYALKAYLASANLDVKKGDVENGLEKLDDLQTHLGAVGDSGDPPAWWKELSEESGYLLGKTLVASGRNSKAIEILNRNLDLFPSGERAARNRLYLGKAYYNDGRFSESADALSRFILENPDSQFLPEAYLNLGWAYERQALFDEAGKSWAKVKKDFPNSPAASEAAAVLAQKKESEDLRQGAAEWLSVANEFSKSSTAPSALFRAGLLYLETIESATAVDCFVRLRRMFPKAENYVESFYWEGAARESLKQTKEALTAYEAFLADSEAGVATGGSALYDEAVMGKARCLNLQDDPTKAITFLKTEIDAGNISPDAIAETRLFLGNLLFERGRCQEAITAFETVANQSRDDHIGAVAQFQIGRCLENLQLFNDAVSALLKVVYLYPKETALGTESEFRAAQILEKQNLYREALRHYKRAVVEGAGEDTKKRADERINWLESHIDALEIELQKE